MHCDFVDEAVCCEKFDGLLQWQCTGELVIRRLDELTKVLKAIGLLNCCCQ
jgi:hypothetical protein